MYGIFFIGQMLESLNLNYVDLIQEGYKACHA